MIQARRRYLTLPALAVLLFLNCQQRDNPDVVQVRTEVRNADRRSESDLAMVNEVIQKERLYYQEAEEKCRAWKQKLTDDIAITRENLRKLIEIEDTPQSLQNRVRRHLAAATESLERLCVLMQTIDDMQKGIELSQSQLAMAEKMLNDIKEGRKPDVPKLLVIEDGETVAP